MMARLAVIGGGWAGCAAAVQAVDEGHEVTLFEMAGQLGGRARRVDVEGFPLDNGQHILDVTGLQIREPLAFERDVKLWPGVVEVGVFAQQKAAVCLLGTATGVQTLDY